MNKIIQLILILAALNCKSQKLFDPDHRCIKGVIHERVKDYYGNTQWAPLIENDKPDKC